MRRRRFLALAAAAPVGQQTALPFQRGVNFTAEWPDVYASDRARQILESLPKYGVNSVAFVPYGFLRAGEANVRFSGTRNWERDADIANLSAIARQKGMKVLLKPQVWIPSGAPTSLDFAKDTERKAFFASYRLYLEHYANLAGRIRADLFSVGVEFSMLARHEADWRTLIGRARELYRGPITYCANWGVEFEGIRFWDAVDYVGLNNYYPLPDSLDTSAVVRKVEAVHQRFRKPVIFPEAGYSSLTAPHKQPWDESPRALSMQDQARCYEAVFQGFYKRPWFQGMYWWKIGSSGFGGESDGSHTPWNKPAMKVMAKWYLRGGR
ncbi:MAG: hypothetical protein JNL98_30825 [Bryobacterales bacterium]|nr:hypothetical protein [Bryobacterales bacterium]